MASALGGSDKGSGGIGLPPVAIGPGEAGQLLSNMYSDAGLGGLGWNAAGTQRVGSPTPDLQYDIAGAEAGPANQAALTNQQIGLIQNQSAGGTSGTQSAAGGLSSGFNSPIGNNSGTG